MQQSPSPCLDSLIDSLSSTGPLLDSLLQLVSLSLLLGVPVAIVIGVAHFYKKSASSHTD